MEICYDGNLVMPSNYVVVNVDEMEYVDGGLYFNSTTVQSIVMTLCGYPTSIAVIANSIKASCVWVTAKLGAAFGPAGWVIAGALSAWVWTQAVTIAERLFSAVMQKKR